MKLKRLAIAAFATSSLLAASAFAATITLNPEATNGLGPAGVLSATNPAFVTDKATTDFASLLSIAALPGSNTNAAFTETGFFLTEAFSGAPSSGVITNYNIYATFTVTGTGSYASGNTFTANNGGLSINVNFYGSPGNQGASGLSFSTPTGGNPTGVTAGPGDFLLGTSTLLAPITATATAITAPTLTTPGIALTVLSAYLDFVPAPGTTGVDGFFQAPIPFQVVLSTSAIGTPVNGGNGTSWVTDGVNSFYTTNVTEKGLGSGSGNIIFATPEPGSLALIGLAFAGMGLLGYRRRSGF